MIKAIFLDFYGTVVFEDGEVINKISKIIYDTGNANNTSEIASFWWKEFQTAFTASYGEHFRLQRELEHESLAKTIQRFNSGADAAKLSEEMFEYWDRPPIFAESKEFFEKCPVPVYIVSNIDRVDIYKAIEYHGLKPAGVFTSEDARSYKPRRELFEYALRESGLDVKDVVHIGDSLSSDVKGAMSLGIDTIWVNRSGREVPKGVKAVGSLLEIFNVVNIPIKYRESYFTKNNK